MESIFFQYESGTTDFKYIYLCCVNAVACDTKIKPIKFEKMCTISIEYYSFRLVACSGVSWLRTVSIFKGLVLQ